MSPLSWFRFLITIVMALSVASAAAAPAWDRDNYRLGAGDRVKVEVFGEPDASTETMLEDDGAINYPLIGPVTAAGLTLRELEQLITQRLADGYILHAKVRASIVQFRPIYVTGQVQRAGSYPYVEGLTIEKALALAGGLTPLGSTRYIYLRHEGHGQEARENVGLQSIVLPGDTIVVEQGLF